MRSKKGLTRVAAEESDESDFECENTTQNAISKQTKTKRDCKFFTLFAVVTLCSIIVTFCSICVYYFNKGDIISKNSGIEGEDDAVSAIDNLMQLNVSYNNFSSNEQLEFEQAFNIFDEDNDGYLNSTEFVNYFKIQLNHTKLFQKMDVNEDNILSFAESVAYTAAINDIKEVHKNYIGMSSKQIEMEYGYIYNSDVNKTQQEKQLFIEYAALIMYFKPFDLDLNGYVRFDEYLIRGSENEFGVTDKDKNGKISLTELGNIMYGDNNDSWKSIALKNFGENYQQIMNELNQIEVTKEMVENIRSKLQICPLQQTNIYKQEDDETRRRLTYGNYRWCWICSWYSGYGGWTQQCSCKQKYCYYYCRCSSCGHY